MGLFKPRSPSEGSRLALSKHPEVLLKSREAIIKLHKDKCCNFPTRVAHAWFIKYGVEFKMDEPFYINGRKLPIFPDFYLPSLNLMFELDGPHHNQKKQKDKDYCRDIELLLEGVKVVRIKSDARSVVADLNRYFSTNISVTDAPVVLYHRSEDKAVTPKPCVDCGETCLGSRCSSCHTKHRKETAMAVRECQNGCGGYVAKVESAICSACVTASKHKCVDCGDTSIASHATRCTSCHTKLTAGKCQKCGGGCTKRCYRNKVCGKCGILCSGVLCVLCRKSG